MRLARILATVGGLGSLPRAPGTAGSAVGLLIGFLWLAHEPASVRVSALVLGVLAGVIASTVTERHLKAHDPPSIVIDELMGMLGVSVVVPGLTQLPWLLVMAFGLFRLFDILKPPPLVWLSRFPGGWGIMLDDLGAAAYTVLTLWVIMRITG